MIRKRLYIGETIASVLIDDPSYLELVRETVVDCRTELEDYIRQHPSFKTSLKPVTFDSSAPEIIQHMIQVSQLLEVGPMATVAGMIAQYVVEAVVAAGCSFIVFDNGGDIALYLDRSIVIGIYTGNHLTNRFGVRLEPRDSIFGVCTSSASVGHSKSFGISDATTVIAKDVLMADATATALGNKITVADPKKLEATIQSYNQSDVEAILVMVEEQIGFWGNLPPIVYARVNYDLISKWELEVCT